MSQLHRLTAGGRIDRDVTVEFKFNGRRYTGFPGDTLASALLANGITLVARSFKYHRPRGVVGSGVEEPNALVQLETGARTIPNARATEVEIYDGLVARSVNAWPNVDFDLMALASLFVRAMPAGFYYKTFMWPRRFWMKYEHFIRKSAGLGQAPELPDPDAYDKMNAHCDVLVAGGGPAGLVAAWAAGKAGARVILADEQSEFGGSLLSVRAARSGASDALAPAAWIAQMVAELRAMPVVRLLPRSTVFGYHDQNFLTINERRTDHLPPSERKGVRERVWRVRAKQVVLATGAIERPLVFANNDRPGIVLASAVSAYLNRYAVRLGARVVVFTNNDSAYRTALELAASGIAIGAVVDARANPQGALPERARKAGITVIDNAVVIDAAGATRVSAVTVMPLAGDGRSATGAATVIDCDLLALSGGWSPVVHLHSQSGGRARFDDARACFVPGVSVQAERSAGACNGAFAVGACVAEGLAAGVEAARLAAVAGAGAARDAGVDAGAARSAAVDARAGAAHSGTLAKAGSDTTYPASFASVVSGDASASVASHSGRAEALPRLAMDDVAEAPLLPLWLVPSPSRAGRGAKAFVDLQNDVAASDIALAAREGYRSIEHVKRYTAMGFGTDQGKLGNINGMAILARALGNDIAATGTTTFRPNYTPVSFGAIVGRDVGELFDPIRKTALHRWHEEQGAKFENVGQWHRPWYFSRTGETMQAAVDRECLAARNGAAIMDASTLGKIDIVGPDAVKLLDWVYTNGWATLDIGRCRYGLMLDENGMVMDDGVTTRLGEHHYLMTTTTGGAARVLSWLERWLQTEWPHLDVYLTSVTDHWATAAVVGPSSRKILQAVCDDIDFAASAFPFMSYREGTVAGVPARVMRISFSGELAYEVNVNANAARHVWDALMAAGAADGITPYGTEAMHVLRAEKGFVIVGQDTDGSVTPIDLGMDWIVSKRKDFIGRRSLSRFDTARGDRKQLVGLLTENPRDVLPEGAQVVVDASAPVPVPMLGHVTSSYWSACLGRSIALAMVEGGRSRMNQTVEVPLPDGRTLRARIASPVFIDPEGARQNV